MDEAIGRRSGGRQQLGHLVEELIGHHLRDAAEHPLPNARDESSDLDVGAVGNARAIVGVGQRDQRVGADEPGTAAALGRQAIGLGRLLSRSRTLPSKVPFTAATPIFSVALYSSLPISSSFSQPGIAFRSVSGSRNAPQTFCRGAFTS